MKREGCWQLIVPSTDWLLLVPGGSLAIGGLWLYFLSSGLLEAQAVPVTLCSLHPCAGILGTLCPCSSQLFPSQTEASRVMLFFLAFLHGVPASPSGLCLGLPRLHCVCLSSPFVSQLFLPRCGHLAKPQCSIRDTRIRSRNQSFSVFHSSWQPWTNSFSLRLASSPKPVCPLRWRLLVLWARSFWQSPRSHESFALISLPWWAAPTHPHTQAPTPEGVSLCRNAPASAAVCLESSPWGRLGQPGPLQGGSTKRARRSPLCVVLCTAFCV